MLVEETTLGNTTSYASFSRNNRYRLLRIAKQVVDKLNIDHRVTGCMKMIKSKSVNVMRNAEGRAYYKGVYSCGSVWVCPVCASRITSARRDELERAIRGNDYKTLLITFTLQHNRSDDLTNLLNGLNSSLRTLKSGRWWRNFRDKYGIAAYCSTLEFTYSLNNGWHPHKHMLVFLENDVNVDDFKCDLVERYTKLIERAGGYASEFYSIDVRAGDDEVGSYLAKWGLADEATKGMMKQSSKNGGYTPFELLVLADEGELFAELAFRDYVQATKGKRQLVWSRNARLLLGLGEERTDEEIAAEGNEDDELIVSFSRDEWNWILACGLEGEILDYAEQGGAEAVRMFLSGVSPPIGGIY